MLLTKTITAVGPEPVTVAEVKVSARIDDDITELDNQIQTLITSTRLIAEHECERNFLPHTLQLGFTGWPSEALPVAPVTELVSVEASDGTGWEAVEGFRWCRPSAASLRCSTPVTRPTFRRFLQSKVSACVSR